MSACVHCSLPVPADRRGGGARFCCVGCRIAWELARPAEEADSPAPSGTLVLRLGVGIFVAMNIMVFSWLGYSRELFGPVAGERAGDALSELFAYLLMFLCSIVVVTLGLPLARDAWQNLRAAGWLRPDTNLLICLGVGAAFLLSVTHTLRGAGSLYYDTAAMILVVVTLGHWIEAGARRRAAASARSLLARVPSRATVLRDGRAVDVAVDDLAPGDLVAARPGDTLVADGTVTEGASRVDESSLTGEARPRPVETGDRVLAGSVNLEGQLWLRADSVGADRVIAAMERLLEAARERQPAIQRVADRVAGWFVPAVVALALGVLAWRAAGGEPTRGLFDALSVLLISCPCALGLAAPLASWQALRLAASHGVLIDSAATLERAAALRTVLFDKTGTLTAPALALGSVESCPGLPPDEALRLAAALEATTAHPIAAAVLDAARAGGAEVSPARDAVTVAGLGVEGRVDGRRLRLGSARFVERAGLALPQARPGEPEALDVYLFDDRQVLAQMRLVETLRPDAEGAVARLRSRGLRVAMLTGDAPGPAHAVASRLGIEARAGLLPADKVAAVHEEGRTGKVAMVGDGLNDAPVLAAADVGFAVGSASDLARRAGNVRLISDRLDRVPLTLAIARRGVRRIRWNLAWAFGYNAIGLALAAAGLLSPVFAASAMFVSSLVVVAISRGAGRLGADAMALEASETAPASAEGS